MMSHILKFARSICTRDRDDVTHFEICEVNKNKVTKNKISWKRNVVFPSNKKIALVYIKVYIMVKVVFQLF